MRDISNLKSPEKYGEDIAFCDAQIDKRRKALAEGIKNEGYAGQYAFQGFLHSFERLQCMYSRGDSIDDLEAYFPQVLELQEWALGLERKCYPAETMESRKLFRLNFDIYVTSLWLLSFALCLDADDATVTRMLRVIGNEGEDALFDRIAARREPGRRIGTSLAYPKVTQALYDALDAPEPKRGKLLVKYVSQWYGRMRRAHWHDAHLRHGGDSYYGYWCFEAAGAVKAFGMDDRLLLDLPHYPKDLARD